MLDPNIKMVSEPIYKPLEPAIGPLKSRSRSVLEAPYQIRRDMA